MASGEVSWDDENDVKEIIADVRDVECDMTWCVLLLLGVEVFEFVQRCDNNRHCLLLFAKSSRLVDRGVI